MNQHRPSFTGMGKADGRLVIVLDSVKALDIDEMSQLCDSEQEAVTA